MKISPTRIFIAEDIPEILEFLAEFLRLNGYDVCTARTFPEALWCIENEPFSLALLDILLPGGGSGLDLLKHIRKNRGNVPVVMQTALDGDNYCVQCLKAGADDFVVKPVRQGPLLARVEAVLRRASGENDPLEKIPLGAGTYVFSPKREIRFEDRTLIRLTFKEMAMLRFLFMQKGIPATTEEILRKVWNANPLFVDSGCVPALIQRLRKKLEGVAKVENIYGSGYILKIVQ